MNKKRICAILTQKEIEYLDKVRREARFSGGFKLSRAEIIRALIKAMMKIKIDVKGVKTEKQLKEKILKNRR